MPPPLISSASDLRAPIPLFRSEESEPTSIFKELKPYLLEAGLARENMTTALLELIDATMPSEAGFVNYEMVEGSRHLTIREAIGGYGEELDREPYRHIEEILVELGLPYGDFDGDLVMSSVDDYGWERTRPYSADRAAEARQAAEAAREPWIRAMTALQRDVIERIWSMVGPDVEALDFAWESEGSCLRLAAAIRDDGRRLRGPEELPETLELTGFLTEPQLTGMLFNELSGLYRLARTAPATDDLAARLEAELPDFLNERFSETGDTISFRDVGVAIEAGDDYSEQADEGGLASIQVTYVDKIEVRDLQVASEDDSHLARTELRLFGNILGKILKHRAGTFDDLAVMRSTIDFSSGYVDVPAVIRWDRYWRIESAAAAETAVLVVTDDGQHATEDDYFQLILESRAARRVVTASLDQRFIIPDWPASRI